MGRPPSSANYFPHPDPGEERGQIEPNGPRMNLILPAPDPPLLRCPPSSKATRPPTPPPSLPPVPRGKRAMPSPPPLPPPATTCPIACWLQLFNSPQAPPRLPSPSVIPQQVFMKCLLCAGPWGSMRSFPLAAATSTSSRMHISSVPPHSGSCLAQNPAEERQPLGHVVNVQQTRVK